MKNSVSYFFLIFNMITFLSVNAQNNDGWKLTKEKNGVKVFTKKTENSSFKTFKAEVEIKSSLSDIENVLLNFNNYSNWVYSNDKTNIIQVMDKDKYLVHIYLGTPWPVSDRDLILEYNFKKVLISY